MSDPVYCTDADLYAHGLPRGAIPNPGRTLAQIVASVCYLDTHGFGVDQAVSFRAVGGALPSGLAEGVTYYADPVTEYTFGVRATQGGSDLTIGANDQDPAILVFVPLAEILAASRAWASRIVDDMLPAHIDPFSSPFPEIIVMTAAELATGHILNQQGAASTSLSQIVADAQKRLARWATGVPLRGADAPPRANTAIAAVGPATDARGWRTYGGR